MKKSSHIDFLYIYLIFYIFWGWIFTKTVFASSLCVYASFLLLLVGFFIKAVNSHKQNNSGVKRVALLWIPFFFYTSLQWLFEGDIQRFSYWLVCVLLVMAGSSDKVSTKVPYRLLLFSGLFAVTGIAIQIFVPSFYSYRVQPLFLADDNIDMWITSEYGFNGFTYQLAATAEILVCAECVILCLWNRIFNSPKSWIKIAVLILIIICVFLTGKRMNSAIAITLPFVLPILSNKNNGRKIFLIAIAILCFVLFANYLLSNADMLLSSSLFRRTAQTILEFQGGGDFSGGRDDIWSIALNLYRSNPVFGIGPGNYIGKSGVGTDVHNMYLQCLCEQGLVGFILFIFPLIYCFVKTMKITRTSAVEARPFLLFSMAIQFVYIVEGVTENMNVNLDGFLMYAIAIAILIDCEYNTCYDKSSTSHIQ